MPRSPDARADTRGALALRVFETPDYPSTAGVFDVHLDQIPGPARRTLSAAPAPSESRPRVRRALLEKRVPRRDRESVAACSQQNELGREAQYRAQLPDQVRCAGSRLSRFASPNN